MIDFPVPDSKMGFEMYHMDKTSSISTLMIFSLENVLFVNSRILLGCVLLPRWSDPN